VHLYMATHSENWKAFSTSLHLWLALTDRTQQRPTASLHKKMWNLVIFMVKEKFTGL